MLMVKRNKIKEDNKGSLALAEELKSPLSSMLGMLDLLLTTVMTAKQKEYLEVACASGQSLMNSIESVITFIEIKNNKLKATKQDCYLIEILDEIFEELSEKALKKSINLGYVIPKNFPALIVTDSVKLRQMLLLLLDNAIKFSYFGEVSLYVEDIGGQEFSNKKPKTVIFKINDKGIGIKKAMQNRVFEPFFKVDNSSDKIYQGLGLGLTVAKSLARIMGGKLTLKSNFGQGTEVSIELPLVTKALEKELDTQQVKQEKLTLNNQKFLLVTASDVLKDQILGTVNSMGGELSIATSAREAINCITQSDTKIFQTIIVDEEVGDMPLADFFGLFEDCLNFSDTFVLILSNPYFSSYQINSLQVARINKPILTSNLISMLANRSQAAKIPNDYALATCKDISIKVLVVDDSRISQHIIEAMLIRLDCYYEITSNGKIAIEKVVYGDFDIVLMDCNMPFLSGYEATRQIRHFEEEEAGRLPIIGMASNTNEKQKAKCISSGMSDYIGKPVGLLDLRGILLKWTGYKANIRAEDIFEKSGQYPVSPRPLVKTLSYDPQALSRLVAILGNSIQGVIKDFCFDLGRYIKSLRLAINEANESEICYLAHTIKGAARNFGAEQMVRLSSQLEAKAHSGQFEDSAALFAKIEAEAQILSNDLIQEKTIVELAAPTNSFEGRDLVLVVDDDRTSRVVLAEALRNSGCEVDEAKDGIEALNICKRCMPDLILMDAIMPGIDGFELCQKIRRMPFGGDIPILIITASECEEVVSKAFSAEATDFLNKPVNASVIQKRVNHLIASKKAERYIKQLAYHDALTGLPNRSNLMQHLQLVLKQAKVENSMFAVLFLDLDHFKLVNDSMGHDTGDLLLKAVSDRLRQYLRGQDFIARLGGDEFTIVLQNIKNLSVAEKIANQICEALKEPFAFLRREIMVTTSIGISVFPNHGNEITDLLKHADCAMFKAKSLRDGYCFYEADMEAAVSDRLDLQRDLHRAFDRNELILHYQPKMRLGKSQLLGAEALLRWNHPVKGLMKPNDFIPDVEGSSFMSMINSWVLEQGVKQLARWLSCGCQLTLSVNISLSRTTLPELHKKMVTLVEQYPEVTGLVELEITENLLMCEPEKMAIEFAKIRDLGVTIALDDFGSGFSSLNHLRKLPVDVLKIDRLFVRDIETNADDRAIVKSIISMASALRIKTVAEGVETLAQKQILSELNCDYFQGFLTSKPLSADQFQQQFLKISSNSKLLATQAKCIS